MGPPFLGKPVHNHHNLILVGVVLNPLKQSRGIHRFINRVSKVARQFVHFFRAFLEHSDQYMAGLSDEEDLKILSQVIDAA